MFDRRLGAYVCNKCHLPRDRFAVTISSEDGNFDLSFCLTCIESAKETAPLPPKGKQIHLIKVELAQRFPTAKEAPKVTLN